MRESRRELMHDLRGSLEQSMTRPATYFLSCCAEVIPHGGALPRLCGILFFTHSQLAVYCGKPQRPCALRPSATIKLEARDHVSNGTHWPPLHCLFLMPRFGISTGSGLASVQDPTPGIQANFPSPTQPARPAAPHSFLALANRAAVF